MREFSLCLFDTAHLPHRIPANPDISHASFMEAPNVALQGTLCTSGSGLGVVVLTGNNTVFGRIARLSNKERTGRTTLQNEILRFVM
jgi:sodium/potassium-transporting ATPase subunit alpha